MKKDVLPIIGGILVLLLAITSVLWAYKDSVKDTDEPESKDEEKNEEPKYEKIDNSYDEYVYIDNYEDYLLFVEENKENEMRKLKEEDFDGKKYLFYTTSVNSCGESILSDSLEKEDNLYKIYFDVEYSCGVCAPYYITYIYEVDSELDVDTYIKVLKREECDPNVVYKPIIYIYPEEEMDLTIKLGKSENLKYTYPKYKNEWHVRVSKDSNIYDYDTNRNYYGLYWEAYDDYKVNMKEGFVVKGEETAKFLEEKLALLGLNEYEINEFIIYWIDKFEGNNYNFISFRNIEDINNSMPLEFSQKPDTLIRVYVDFKSLDDYIEVKEQLLTKVERKGFTVVEWGGTYNS